MIANKLIALLTHLVVDSFPDPLLFVGDADAVVRHEEIGTEGAGGEVVVREWGSRWR